jgi:pyruvate ferredoxin oxidoreductase gamma subunit
MYQIRIHGRGGQGVVTAAELIAISAFNDDWQAQAFPHFGVERTGAPIEAFARISKQPIRTREHVQKPDFLIIQDASLLSVVDVTKGAHEKTKAIVNTSLDKADLDLDLPKENIFTIDATKIALEILGKNIVNTVIIGAFAGATELFTINSIKKAIKQKFEHKGKSLIEKNIKAVEVAYDNE